jgi:hypothetical protein
MELLYNQPTPYSHGIDGATTRSNLAYQSTEAYSNSVIPATSNPALAHPSAPNAPSRSYPYIIYSNGKATLNIVGDLQSMSENWTNEEKYTKRRLVQFQTTNNDGTITFRAISQPQNELCVSCIFLKLKGKEKAEYYVTSFDTIELLKGLLDVSLFTVEQKNRFRRNLESYKPYTVSKKVDERAFEVIMGFSDPMPRSIKMDLKLIHWSLLFNALQKLIDKWVSLILSPNLVDFSLHYFGRQDISRHHCY